MSRCLGSLHSLRRLRSATLFDLFYFIVQIYAIQFTFLIGCMLWSVSFRTRP